MTAHPVKEARQGSRAWLDARQLGVGSSDAATIAGESPWSSPLQLWSEKTGRLTPPEPDAETAMRFRIGHALEEPLLALYREETHRKTRREPRLLRHPKYPWMLASLDARVVGESRIAEVKWSSSRRWHGEEAIPGDVLCQVQHAMAVTGTDFCDVIALLGPNLRITEVARDDEFIAALVTMEETFWNHVLMDTPPPPDSSESARVTLGRLHPRDDGTMLPPTDDLQNLAIQYRRAKDRVKEAEDYELSIGNAVRAILGDASGAEGLFTYRKTETVTKTDWQGYALDLLELVPPTYEDRMRDIRAARITTAEGPRVLRLLKGDSK